jgi:hypothetical protein
MNCHGNVIAIRLLMAGEIRDTPRHSKDPMGTTKSS